MECPKCGGKLRVLDNTSLDGVTYRKRRCNECGKVIWTTERSEPQSMIGYLDGLSVENQRYYKNRKG